MITRRQWIVRSAGALFLSTTAASNDRSAVDAKLPPGDRIALPGKKSLIKRTYRPPNFETPIVDLRSPFTANDAFFVRYHLSQIPEVDARRWRLRVGGGATTRTLEFSLEELRQGFEQVSLPAICQCSGNRRGLFTPRVPGVQWQNGAMGNAMWTGVRLRDVLAKAGLKGDALEVVFEGADGPVLSTPDFSKSLPVDRALEPSTLIALGMNGQPLPHWNGAPARLIVPGWTATYWMKHLTEVRAEPQPFDGFWMQRAYRVPKGAFPGASFPTQAKPDTVPITEILVNSLVTSHVSGEHLLRGRPTELQGWAWDKGAGISSVEVSSDQGATWRPASLGRDLGRFAWRHFSYPLNTSRPGTLSLSIRATSGDGTRQPDKLIPNPAGYHDNRIQTLSLEVV